MKGSLEHLTQQILKLKGKKGHSLEHQTDILISKLDEIDIPEAELRKVYAWTCMHCGHQQITEDIKKKPREVECGSCRWVHSVKLV